MSQLHPAIVVLIAVGVALLAALKVFAMIKFYAQNRRTQLWITVAGMSFFGGLQLAFSIAALDHPTYGYPVWLRMTFATGFCVCAVVLLREAIKADAKLDTR